MTSLSELFLSPFFYVTIIVAMSLLYHGYLKKKEFDLKMKEVDLEQSKVELELERVKRDE